jgi:uncharacterized protein (DUF58 family)
MTGGDARDSLAGGFRRHDRRSYHLHPPGVIYLITTFFVAIGGFNSQNNLLFWAFGVAIAGLILSGIVSGAPLMNLKLARDRVEPGAVGEPLRVRYRVKNTGRLWPAFALRVDELGDRKGRSDWWSAFETIVTHVGPRETVCVGAETNALRRGIHEICTVRVSTTFPLGLVRKSLYFDLPQRVTVRPRVLELRHEVRAQLIPSFEHTARSRNRVGPGDEFYALREYEPGDPIRSIAWRASARRDTLLVRQNAAPAPPRISISLESPPPDLPEQHFENTISLVASIVAAARDDRLTIGLAINWAQVWFEPAGGQAAIGRMLDALAAVDVSQSLMTGPSDATHDLLVTFSPTSHEGAICGADTAHWAAEPGSTMIAPPPTRPRRPIKRLGRWVWGGVRKSWQREGV